jgi:3-isopropylmalate dehydratase small subunit
MPLFTIDLAAQIITSPSGLVVDFQLDPTRKRKLLLGLDEIGETLEHLADIEAFEATLRGAGKALMRLDE